MHNHCHAREGGHPGVGGRPTYDIAILTWYYAVIGLTFSVNLSSSPKVSSSVSPWKLSIR